MPWRDGVGDPCTGCTSFRASPLPPPSPPRPQNSELYCLRPCLQWPCRTYYYLPPPPRLVPSPLLLLPFYNLNPRFFSSSKRCCVSFLSSPAAGFTFFHCPTGLAAHTPLEKDSHSWTHFYSTYPVYCKQRQTPRNLPPPQRTYKLCLLFSSSGSRFIHFILLRQCLTATTRRAIESPRPTLAHSTAV
ncbi:hypothetical protein EV126DRAFT_116804 [Verticillium dahliae]|nr:hypothetical protein EV126DRAFT_116804 [Verticillium dahliae]